MRNENADNERKKHHRGRRRKKKGNIIANVILVIALIVFCVSGFQLFKIGKGYLDGRNEYDKVRKLAVTDDKNKNDKDKNHSEDGDDTFSVDFQKLLEINPDVIRSSTAAFRLVLTNWLAHTGKYIQPVSESLSDTVHCKAMYRCGRYIYNSKEEWFL